LRHRGTTCASRRREESCRVSGATTAALFLDHFVGETPWAHLDIAGTMQSDSDDSWRSKGATGFGTRILIEVAREFRPTK